MRMVSVVFCFSTQHKLMLANLGVVCGNSCVLYVSQKLCENFLKYF